MTCAPDHVPNPLVEQLKEGGRMIIPVGPSHNQSLYLLRKEGGEVRQHAVLPVRFVPMTSQAKESKRWTTMNSILVIAPHKFFRLL